MWQQLVAPDLGVQDEAGMCARFTWKVFQEQSAIGYDSAIAAWNGLGNPYPQHRDMAFPDGCAVPVYYDWGAYGHAAVWVSGRGVLSSPLEGYGQQWFDSVEACGAAFGATYLGWREDMAGVPVAHYVQPVSKGKRKRMGAFYRNPGGGIAWQEKPNTALIPIDLTTWQGYAAQGNKYQDISQKAWDNLIKKFGTKPTP